MPELSALQWTLCAAGAFFAGLAKTGVPGLGIMIVPLMVLAAGGARESAGWLLPLLIFADCFAVMYWRRHARLRDLLHLAPWVLAGLAAGAFALSMDEKYLRPMVGVIVLVMMAVFLYRRHFGGADVKPHPAGYGLAAGFSTTVANAAGPVMNLYLLSMRLPKEQFLGTGAWFFFMVNCTKVPVYLGHGMITPRSLTIDACVAPAVVLGAFLGRKLVNHVPEKVFEVIVVVLTLVSTIFLFR